MSKHSLAMDHPFPDEVSAAERTLSLHMTKEGFDQWEYRDCAARSLVGSLRAELESLKASGLMLPYAKIELEAACARKDARFALAEAALNKLGWEEHGFGWGITISEEAKP